MTLVRRKRKVSRVPQGLLKYLEVRLGSSEGHGVESSFPCPFCMERTGDESSSNKLYVNLSKGAGYCFRCEYGFRDWFSFFVKLNGGNIRYDELLFLSDNQDVSPPEVTAGFNLRAALLGMLYVTKASIDLRKIGLPKEAVPLKGSRHKRSLGRVFSYLDDRRVDDSSIDRFNIHYAHSGRYGGYLMFPVFQGGDIVYFTTRYAGKHCDRKSFDPKKLVDEDTGEATHYHKGCCLLNYDNVIGAKSITLVEGAFDCMATDPSLSMMGKHLTNQQLALIASLVPFGLQEVVIMLDADAAGNSVNLYDRLSQRVPHVSVAYLAMGDPDENKASMCSIMDSRREPGPVDRVLSVLRRKK